MSYLPRMSKTYKEPRERPYEEKSREITFNSIPIASALPDDKVYYPHTLLKQYNFCSHSPPELPGPSLIKEAVQNEKIFMEAKRRRTKEENDIKNDQYLTGKEDFWENFGSDIPVQFNAATKYTPVKDEQNSTESTNNRKLTCKSTKVLRKGSLKIIKNKEMNTFGKLADHASEKNTRNATKLFDSVETMVTWSEGEREKKTIGTVGAKTLKAASEGDGQVKEEHTNRNKTEKEHQTQKIFQPKCSVHEGVQFSPTVAREKLFAMPSSIHFLTRALSFLVRELDRYEEGKPVKEVKKLLLSINEALTLICNRTPDKRYVLQTSVSDCKRFEKICNDLEQYVKKVYGENGKLGCKSHEKKKMYCALHQKEYELTDLSQKLRESEIEMSNMKAIENMTKAPEVLLQNLALENEQLLAEIGFSSNELRQFQIALAEKNWEIDMCKEQISTLKKRLATLGLKRKKNDL